LTNIYYLKVHSRLYHTSEYRQYTDILSPWVGCTSELISSRHILSWILLANTRVHTGIWVSTGMVDVNLGCPEYYISMHGCKNTLRLTPATSVLMVPLRDTRKI